MSLRKIALMVFAAIVAIPVLLTLWSWAGSLVSSPNSMAVFVGFIIYAAIVAVMVVLIVVGVRKLQRKFADTSTES